MSRGCRLVFPGNENCIAGPQCRRQHKDSNTFNLLSRLSFSAASHTASSCSEPELQRRRVWLSVKQMKRRQPQRVTTLQVPSAKKTQEMY